MRGDVNRLITEEGAGRFCYGFSYILVLIALRPVCAKDALRWTATGDCQCGVWPFLSGEFCSGTDEE